MEVLKLTGIIDSSGHLHLDIPTQLAPGQVDLVVVVNPQPLSTTSPTQPSSQNDSKIQTTGDSILNLVENFTANLSEEEIQNLPTDGAEQHDHYLYGSPKKDQ